MSPFAVSRSDEQLAALRRGTVVVRVQPAVFRVVGSGALDCLQGLLTNDLAAPGVVRRPVAGEPLPLRLRVVWRGADTAPATHDAVLAALGGGAAG
jgi:folate-binding Fe-S cluster repair protein YgfZ